MRFTAQRVGRWPRTAGRALRSRGERGYAAILVAFLCPVVLIACAALSVDTARWYVEAGRVQAAADAAALAGVVWMPSDFATAKSSALSEAKKNGYDDASSTVVVTVAQADKPSRLKVTVTSTIPNAFGQAIGTPRTTISRSAVADYAGGLSMGSPCNEFGSDPDATSTLKSTNCSNAGDFWANVGSAVALKSKGDAFQDSTCAAGVDGCTTSSGPNTDYDPNGYFYTVTLSRATSNLKLQVFDPALISVGDHCGSNLAGASAIAPSNTALSPADPSTRYAGGDGAYCTGDNDFSGSAGFTNQVATSYTVHMEGASDDATRPATWPTLSSGQCPGATTYPGYDGDLSKALDTTNAGYQPTVAATFRRWVTLCSLTSSLPAGTTLAIQVKTNGNGSDTADGHNRFSLRAFSSSSTTAKDFVAVAAATKMAVYANVQGGSSRFFLTRVPSSTAGQTLTVSLFDIGDISGGTGTLTFVAPSESGVTFSNCRGAGPVSGTVASCQFTASSAFNGKWETVYIPIPTNYTCNDTSPTGCWVKLNYDLSGTTAAQDTTSWRSTIDGQPVRLIQ